MLLQRPCEDHIFIFSKRILLFPFRAARGIEIEVCSSSLVLVHDSDQLVVVLLHGLLDLLANQLVLKSLLLSRFGWLVQVGMTAFHDDLLGFEVSEQRHCIFN